MSRGRISVLIPAVYDELDKELLSGIRDTGVLSDDAAAELREAIIYTKDKFLGNI